MREVLPTLKQLDFHLHYNWSLGFDAPSFTVMKIHKYVVYSMTIK
jgi:hypothetical protein